MTTTSISTDPTCALGLGILGSVMERPWACGLRIGCLWFLGLWNVHGSQRQELGQTCFLHFVEHLSLV